jgi:hypothetical protein
MYLMKPRKATLVDFLLRDAEVKRRRVHVCFSLKTFSVELYGDQYKWAQTQKNRLFKVRSFLGAVSVFREKV